MPGSVVMCSLNSSSVEDIKHRAKHVAYPLHMALSLNQDLSYQISKRSYPLSKIKNIQSSYPSMKLMIEITAVFSYITPYPV